MYIRSGVPFITIIAFTLGLSKEPYIFVEIKALNRKIEI